MPLNLNVTVLTVDNHDQEEFLHLVHQAAIAIRFLRAAGDYTDIDRERVRSWLEALRNHAETDLAARADRLELLRQAIEADFLRINLSTPPQEGDEATPAPGTV